MPTSPAQIAANRSNAQKSTGPTSAEGKAISGRNAIRHGLLARHVDPKDDEHEAYLALRGAIAASLDPQTPLEALLCEQVAHQMWRLGKVATAERQLEAMTTVKLYERRMKAATGSLAQFGDKVDAELYSLTDSKTATLLRYQTTIERSMSRTLDRLERLQAARMGKPLPTSVTIDISLALPVEPAPNRSYRKGPANEASEFMRLISTPDAKYGSE